MQLVNLDEYRHRDVIEVAKKLLESAERGEIRGLVFVVSVAPGDNRAGVAGEYKRRPEEALKATFKLERLLWRAEPFAGSI